MKFSHGEKYLSYQGNSVKCWCQYSAQVLKPVDLSGGKSVLRSVLNIFLSQSKMKTSSIGVSFFLFLESSSLSV